MKSRFSSLKIDSYNFKMDPKSPVNNLNLASFSQYIPPDVSEMELRIHEYLDAHHVKMMDVKTVIN